MKLGSDRKGPRLGGSGVEATGGTGNGSPWWGTWKEGAELSLEYDATLSNCQGPARGSETSETGGLMIKPQWLGPSR